MTRYIDADALSELVGEPIEVFLSRLDLKLPPIIDAEPVKHGKWIEYPTADGMNQCSNCGVLRVGESNYCPNCGARMDAERIEQ